MASKSKKARHHRRDQSRKRSKPPFPALPYEHPEATDEVIDPTRQHELGELRDRERYIREVLSNKEGEDNASGEEDLLP